KLIKEPTKKEVNGYIKSLEEQLKDYEVLELARFDDDGGSLNYSSLDDSFYSLDKTKTAYDFQVSGVHFVEKAGFNALIADQMGLGKTIQALITLKRNKATLTPTLIIVKGSTILQWAKELKTWLDNHPLGVMPIVNRECIIP